MDWKGLEDGGNQVEVRPAFNILYMGFNPEKNEKLQDKKVREALGLAIDREARAHAAARVQALVDHLARKLAQAPWASAE